MNPTVSLDLSKLTKSELLIKCDEIGLTKVKSKTKPELIALLSAKNIAIEDDSLDSDCDETDSDNSDLDANIVIQNDITIDVESEPPMDLTGYKFIDLFCGIGGFHQALHKMGATCVLACDIDKECRIVYKDNYGIEPVSNVKDIDEKTMDDFDILCAGFPCFVAGTQTLTNNGYKNIEDVLITDVLLTHTGKFQNIVNLQKKLYTGYLMCINISYCNEIITCTPEHPFYVREQKKNWSYSKGKYTDYSYGEPIWKNASNLSITDYVGMIINTKEEVPILTFGKDTIKLDNPDHWFTMGYYLGDKYTKRKTDCLNKYAILFSFDNDDNDSLNRVKNILELEPIRSFTDEFSYDITVYSCDNYIWFDILSKLDKNFVPEWIQNLPKHLIFEFISGYLSASGYGTKGAKTIFIVNSSNLAHSFQRLYLKLGHIIKIDKVFCDDKVQYQIVILNSIIHRDDSSVFIEKNYAWYAVHNIKSRDVENEPVYNFEVEIDNSYIVENVCVHNCQAFSNGGKKKCFDDERGLLFDEIVRIAKAKKPRFMFLENVKHILKVSNGEVIEYIKNKIAALGYKLQLFQISPHNYGIPQQRERVYFVCVRNDIYNGTDIVLPSYIGKMEFQKFLDKKEEIAEKYFIKGDTLDVLESWDLMVKTFDVGEKISPTIMINDAFNSYTQTDFDGFPVWKKDYITKNKPLIEKYRTQFTEWYKTYTLLLKKREIYGKLEWQTGPIKENDSIFNHFIQIRQSGIRVKKGHYFPTLVAIAQIPIYGKEKRYITPRECARLQSFPESFKLSPDDKKSYKQLGNSVNVNNVYTVISSTLKKYV